MDIMYKLVHHVCLSTVYITRYTKDNRINSYLLVYMHELDGSMTDACS